MKLRLLICFFIINVFYSLRVEGTVTFDFETKFNYAYNLMPYGDLDTLYKYISEYRDSANFYNNKIAQGNVYFLYGCVNMIMKSEYIEAYKNFIQGLRIFEEQNYKEGISKLKLQLGLINYILKNSEQAIYDLEEAYKEALETGNKRRMGVCRYLIALTLIDMKRIEAAKIEIDKSEDFYKEVNFSHGLTETKFVNAIILLEQGHYETAIKEMELCLDLLKELPYGRSFISSYLAKAYLLAGDVKKARHAAELGLELSKQIKKPHWELNALEVYKDILYAQKEYKNAADISFKYMTLKDSIYNVGSLYKTAVMKFEYDTERKDMQDAVLLTKKEEIQKAALGKQKLLTNVFLITSVVVLLLVMGIFHQYKQKVKTNQELAVALLDLKKTQDQLILKEKLASLGQLTAGIAHEIQNPLNFVNNFAQVSLEMAEEAEQVTNLEEAKLYITDIKSNLSKVNFHGNRVTSIIKSMLQHSRSSKQETVMTDINKFVEDFINIAITGRKTGNLNINFDIKYSFDENLPPIKVVQQDLGRVLINLFNNAFDAITERSMTENGTYKPAISIATGITNNFVFISISDNGKGIPEEIKQRIFEPFFTTKKAGAGTGLGLSITNEILVSHGGMLKVESIPNAGSTFRISLPVS